VLRTHVIVARAFINMQLAIILPLILQAWAQPLQQKVRPEVGWGILDNTPKMDTDAYYAELRTDYKFRIQSEYVQYTIDMRVDPCRDLLQAADRGDACCSESNIAACQHHYVIVGGPDLQVAYFQNSHIANCQDTEFEADPNCGTYIEVHRPGDKRVLSDKRIDKDAYPNGYRTIMMSSNRLCFGEHELWWVVRSRAGPFVQKTRRFMVRKPSCPTPEGAVGAPEFGLPEEELP